MLVLVRHGQTDANARGLLLGRADPPLSELGRRQAEALAALVPGAARVVASPLIRTVETASAFGRPVEIDDRWIELDLHDLSLQYGSEPEPRLAPDLETLAAGDLGWDAVLRRRWAYCVAHPGP